MVIVVQNLLMKRKGRPDYSPRWSTTQSWYRLCPKDHFHFNFTEPQQPLSALFTTHWTNDYSSIRDLSFGKTDKSRGYVDLFLTEHYLHKIVDCTNRYAENTTNSSQHPTSKNCKPLTIEELRTFIGLLYHAVTAWLITGKYIGHISQYFLNIYLETGLNLFWNAYIL